MIWTLVYRKLGICARRNREKNFYHENSRTNTKRREKGEKGGNEIRELTLNPYQIARIAKNAQNKPKLVYFFDKMGNF